MATVTISDLRKTFDGHEVLRGVSAEVGDGEFVVLVGPSGCGKSTLLRLVAGLDPITSGTVAIDGSVVNDVPPKDRDIAMVFQGYALYPHMTVEENMGFSLRLHGRARAEVAARVAEVAESLGLAGLLDRYPRALSGGQRQRVAMGRAIVRRPRLFLFDEPLSNLDAKLRVQMRAELREMHARMRVTSIYVTHDQVEAMTLADRVVVLRDGVVEQAGRPLDLFDRPANTFVAGFIGSPAMNLLPGTAEAGGVRLGDGTLLPLAGGRGPLTLGVRPEDLDVLPEGAEGIPARARTVEPTGSETTLVAEMADGTAVTAVARERLHLAPGAPLRLRPRGARVHRFDAGGLRVSP